MTLNCEVVLIDPVDGVMHDNCYVSGIVKYSVEELLEVYHITLCVEGVGHCKWTEWRFYARIPFPHFHSGVERYVTGRKRLVEPTDGEKFATIQPGEYEFPFSVLIPSGVASSSECKKGYIRYKAEVTVSRRNRRDIKFTRTFKVHSQIDLNLKPGMRDPMLVKEKAKLYNIIVRCGDMNVEVRTVAGGFVPGQTVPVLCTIHNESKVKVKHLTIDLLQNTTYTSRSESKLREPTKSVVKVKVVPNQNGAEYNAHADINIPNNAIVSMLNSKIISIIYSIKVTVQVTGFHLNPVVTLPIVIGTVPIVETPAAVQRASGLED